MRVTIVIGGLSGGGAERVCVNLANAWAAARLDVTIVTVTQQRPGSVYPLDSRIARVDLRWPRVVHDDTAPVLRGLREAGCMELSSEAHLMTALRAAILGTTPDVVVSHMDITNVRVLGAIGDTHIPVVACEHTDPHRNYLGPWHSARDVLYRGRAAAVVAPHDSIAAWFMRRGISGVHMIANPLLSPQARPLQARERRRLITLGRLSPEKRIAMIAGAFARIADDFPDWDLEIYGEGPQRDEIARMTNERIHLHAFTDDPYAALLAADLYVSASCVEGFGNAIWEAMACGLPIVAMDCGGPVSTLVRDGIDGRVVRGQEHELALALSAFMEDDAMRGAFAARAAEVVDRYPLWATLAKWDRVLTGVVEGARV
jgi:glycosyltransferase involved in cell wall biosynthesis